MNANRAMRHWLQAVLFILAMLAAPAQPAVSGEAPYFQGKTIRMIISSPPGGGTDTSGRLVAAFLPKYLPGNPSIIIQNIPGGAATIANNIFAHEAKPDGLTLLQDASSGVGSFVRGGSHVKYDPRKYRGIGGVYRGGSLLMVRKDARSRLTNPSAKKIVVGDTDGIRNWVAMTVWGAEYLGWNLRWIYGFQGSADMSLGLRQGEIEMWSTQNAQLIRDLKKDGLVDFLCQEDDPRRPDFPDVPTFTETLGEKRPSGLAWEAFKIWNGSGPLDKILSVPEGTPDSIVKALRDAYQKMAKDPEFKVQADKFFGEAWTLPPGERMEQVVRDSINVNPEAKELLRQIRKKYGLPQEGA